MGGKPMSLWGKKGYAGCMKSECGNQIGIEDWVQYENANGARKGKRVFLDSVCIF